MARSLTVVVGAGTGGIVAARRLRDRLPSDHRLLVVDARPEVSWAPGYVGVVAGSRSPQQLTRRLSGLARLGLEFRCAEVVAIDPAARTLGIAGDRVKADAIVLAPGARLAMERLPGAAGVAHNFYELDAALRLRAALGALKGGRVLVAIAGPPYRCPAAPHEATLAIHRVLKRRRKGATVSLVTPEPQPMPVAGPAVGRVVLGLYERHAIEARFGAARPVRVHSSSSTSAGTPPSAPIAGELELEGGERLPFDLLVLIPPHAAPNFLARSDLLETDGWIAADRATLATRHPGVWALGDVTAIPLANGGALPKAGVFARAMAETVAREVVAHLLNGGERTEFAGRGGCHLATAPGFAAYAEGDFFAEPEPRVTLHGPSRRGWWGRKVEEWGWRREY